MARCDSIQYRLHQNESGCKLPKERKLILNVKPTISKNIYCLATVLTDSSNNSLTNYLRRGIQVTRSLLKRKRIKNLKNNGREPNAISLRTGFPFYGLFCFQTYL